MAKSFRVTLYLHGSDFSTTIVDADAAVLQKQIQAVWSKESDDAFYGNVDSRSGTLTLVNLAEVQSAVFAPIGGWPS